MGKRQAETIAPKAAAKKRFTDARRLTFLSHLAVSCNVTKSADVAELTHSSVYHYRRKDAAFAAEWDEALTEGYGRLEAMLLAKAGAAIDESEGAIEGARLDSELALRLLTLRHTRLKSGDARRRTNRIKRATPEEVDAELLRRIEAVERREAKLAHG